jgi:hypothetical protein
MLTDYQASLGENAGNAIENHLCQDLVAIEGPFIWCRAARCSSPLSNFQTPIKQGVRSWDSNLYIENIMPSSEEDHPDYIDPAALADLGSFDPALAGWIAKWGSCIVGEERGTVCMARCRPNYRLKRAPLPGSE